MVNIFAAAPGCSELLDRDPAWKSTPVTAMICRDLQTVPEVPLPAGLTLRVVRRRADDPPDGVPSEMRPPALRGPASTRPTPGCRSTGGSGSSP
jgi:hypothetical protein